MPDVIRLLGLISAAMATGSLVALAVARPGTTGFAVPWRYWGAAAGLIIEVNGIYSRLSLWGSPLEIRDVAFLAANVCIFVACVGAVTNPPATPRGRNR
jgi:hypothetical protein